MNVKVILLKLQEYQRILLLIKVQVVNQQQRERNKK
jgi:hypothetical protein